MKKCFVNKNSTRRSAAALAAVFMIAGMLTAVLSGCALSGDRLYVLSYGDYMDADILATFEEEYGIKVVCDTYAAPEDMYAKLVSGATKYDLVCASDYIVEKLIGENRLSALDFENIPNYQNIDPKFTELSRSFDPKNEYSVPHFWGTLGILYDTTKVSSIETSTWNVLFDDRFSDQIIMPNSERDAMFIALKILGIPVNTTDTSQLDKAADLLVKQKPLVQAYLLDESARSKVVSGNAAMAVIYNGEAYLAMEDNDDLDFIVPTEGSYAWIDSWCVPATAQHQDYAEKFLDFLCREDIAETNFEYIYYSTPNKAVTDSLEQDILDIEAIFPDDETLEKCEVLSYLGSDAESYYSKLWKMIKSE